MLYLILYAKFESGVFIFTDMLIIPGVNKVL